MKRIMILFLTLILLTNFSSCQETWLEYQLDNNKITIQFPGKPIIKHITPITIYGDVERTSYIYESPDKSKDNFIYSFSYGAYPKGTLHSDSTQLINAFFETMKDGMIKGMNGELISETKISIDGYVGRKVVLNINNGMARVDARMFFINDTPYFLQVITPINNIFNKSATKFFNSFKLNQKK